jgi:O-antigen ligase
MTREQILPRLPGGLMPAALVLSTGSLVGWGAVQGRPWIELCLLLSAALAASAVVDRRRIGFPKGFLVVELPILLLVAEVYASRRRSSEQLAANPLDLAAQAKVVLIGLALVIGAFAFATGPARGPRTGLTFRLFGLYVAVVFLGMYASVDPSLTAFRGLELAAAVVAVAGAYRRFGHEAVVRIERLLYAVVFGLVASVWLVLLISPQLVLVPAPASPLPWQLEGAYPAIASNGVGTLGLILALWSLGRLWESTPSRPAPRPFLVAALLLGIATLVGAQYRTGYVALAAGIALLLVVRGRRTLALLSVLAVTVVAIWGSSGATERSQPLLLRGDSTAQARELSGRLSIWRHAIPVWQESPLVGRGLLTSTRLEVLPSIGLANTATVHGTWIEALVGTGVLGAGLLAASLIVLLSRAVAHAVRPGGRVVPILLLSALIVRSATGSSVESLGLGVLVLLVLALGLQQGTVLSPSTGRIRAT